MANSGCLPRFAVMTTLMVAVLASAQEPPAALALAIAKANGVPQYAFETGPTLTTLKPGWRLRWSRMEGDSGTQRTDARYRTDGSLETMESRVEYSTHSWGPGDNRAVTVRVVRTFDAHGTLTKLAGSSVARRLRDGKVVENRKITSATDEVVGDLDRPLLVLPRPPLE